MNCKFISLKAAGIPYSRLSTQYHTDTMLTCLLSFDTNDTRLWLQQSTKFCIRHNARLTNMKTNTPSPPPHLHPPTPPTPPPPQRNKQTKKKVWSKLLNRAKTEHLVTCLPTVAYFYKQHPQFVLLFLVLAVNSNWFQSLWSYTLLLKLPVFMHTCYTNQGIVHLHLLRDINHLWTSTQTSP